MGHKKFSETTRSAELLPQHLQPRIQTPPRRPGQFPTSFCVIQNAMLDIPLPAGKVTPHKAAIFT